MNVLVFYTMDFLEVTFNRMSLSDLINFTPGKLDFSGRHPRLDSQLPEKFLLKQTPTSELSR